MRSDKEELALLPGAIHYPSWIGKVIPLASDTGQTKCKDGTNQLQTNLMQQIFHNPVIFNKILE